MRSAYRLNLLVKDRKSSPVSLWVYSLEFIERYFYPLYESQLPQYLYPKKVTKVTRKMKKNRLYYSSLKCCRYKG